MKIICCNTQQWILLFVIMSLSLVFEKGHVQRIKVANYEHVQAGKTHCSRFGFYGNNIVYLSKHNNVKQTAESHVRWRGLQNCCGKEELRLLFKYVEGEL